MLSIRSIAHNFNYCIYSLAFAGCACTFSHAFKCKSVNQMTNNYQTAASSNFETSAKRQIIEKMKIGTHNGYFHCDEALAVYMLTLLKEYRDAEILRSRDPKVWEKCDVLVDVGGVFDPEKFRFDHHQLGFHEYFSEDHTVTILSSAGLVYKYFAKRIFEEVFGVTDKSDKEELYQYVYNEFIENVDAVDNGVAVAEGKLRYKCNTDLASRVSRLNPSWAGSNASSDVRLDVFINTLQECFKQAVKITGEDFDYFVKNYISTVLPAKTMYHDAYSKRFQLHDSGRVIELPKSCPFSHYMYHHEEQEHLDDKDKILYYVSLDTSSNSWYFLRRQLVLKSLLRRASCTRTKGEQFKSRLPFPTRLCGLPTAELAKESGIPDLTFIHRAGFTCAAKSKQAILDLITLTIKEAAVGA